MLFPAMPTVVQAEEGNMTTTLSVEPTIAISLPNTIAFDLTPSADGVFASSTASLAVSTNNETGYSLYFSTTDTDNSLHGQNPATTETIAAVSGSTTEENFENNTWGYNLSLASAGDATTYEAVPTSRETALLTTEAPSNDNYNLTFGAKVSTAMPSGTYTNTVAVSVVVNPKIISSLVDLTYMQDMTQEICAKSSENDTKRLIDSRDGKYYWVAKLKDGNCWMTQNLDFDIPAEGITSADSDISDVWNSTSTYPPTATSSTIYNDDKAESTLSWDPGMYVNSNPGGPWNCEGTDLDVSTCTSLVNVASGYNPMTEISSDGVIISGSDYDAHYLIGNYYQWNAATAGTGGSDIYTDPTGSICPKGWHLPRISDDGVGSANYLFTQYDSTAPYLGSFYSSAPFYIGFNGYIYEGDVLDPGYWVGIWNMGTFFNWDGEGRPIALPAFPEAGRLVRCLAD